MVGIALEYARMYHKNQMYGSFPYFNHIKQTVTVAMELGYDEDIQIACALHDILEDTPLSYNDIKCFAGEKIADVVYDVTDELGKTRKERKDRTYPKISANPDAILVKLCDRIANVRHSYTYNERMYNIYRKENAKFLMGITKGITFTPAILKGFLELRKAFVGEIPKV